LAEQVCNSLIDVQFTSASLAKLNNYFGGQITGAEYLDMHGIATTAICKPYALAAATRTAGLSYQQYKSFFNGTPITGVGDEAGLQYKIDPSPIAYEDWQVLDPLKLGKYQYSA